VVWLWAEDAVVAEQQLTPVGDFERKQGRELIGGGTALPHDEEQLLGVEGT
jgi:hypothetical protein